MLNVGRRQVLAGIGAIPIAGLVSPRRAAAQAKPLKVLLNSSFSGPQAFFFLADEQGYLRQEGLEVEFFPGDGAAAVVPRIVPEGFDAGYGDLNALIELVARDPAQAPIAVYTTFNWTPLTIAVAADGPIKSPKDLEGRTINSHPDDAALRAFPALANVAGIDPAKVTVVTSDVSMRELAEDTIAGKTAGTFGFVNTIIAALAIPTSVITTFALMKYMGFTQNNVTLLALTLSVGIVIDDAIVVLENVFRVIEEHGLNPVEAAIRATKEIGLAVVAITLSLVAVFLPVAFMAGIVGRFLNSFGITMACAIAVSMFISFSLTPMLPCRARRRHDPRWRRG